MGSEEEIRIGDRIAVKFLNGKTRTGRVSKITTSPAQFDYVDEVTGKTDWCFQSQAAKIK